MAEEEYLPEETGDESEAPDVSETSRRRWHLPRPHINRRVVLQWTLAIALTVLVLIVFYRMALEPLFFSSEPEESSHPVFPADSDWPSSVAVTPHTVPAIIKNEISIRGDQHGYEFEGTAGDIWRITVDPLDTSALDPIVTLYGPSGAEVARNDDRSADDIASELRFPLPESGIYRLMVESSLGGITTGGYWMEVWSE